MGSTSLAADGTSGAKVSRVLYYPYGETRYSEGALPTDYTYTGQRDVGLGLMHYGARYYHANDGSYDWDWGIWWADMDDLLIAHEAGHVFGLPDYHDVAHHDWITGNPNGMPKPGTGEVYEIIGTAKYQYFHYDEDD